MKKKLKIFGIYLPIFIISLVATVTMRTISCLTWFNSESGYFDQKLLITISDAILILSVIGLFTYLFVAKKDMKLIPSFTSFTTYVPTGAVGVAIAFMAIYLFEQYSVLKGSEFAAYSVIALICGIFAILSIVHFILTALVESHSSAARANFGLCTVVFLSLYAIHLYFDTSVPLNAPNRLVSQMAYLASALFFLYETRLSMGREKWREYIAFGFVSSLLTAYASIPAIICYFAKESTIANSIYDSVLAFALFIFITARLLLTGELIEDKKSYIVEALSASAKKRADTVSESDRLYEAQVTEEAEDAEEENDLQISLDDDINLQVEELSLNTETEDASVSGDADNSEQDIPDLSVGESEQTILTDSSENDIPIADATSGDLLQGAEKAPEADGESEEEDG